MNADYFAALARTRSGITSVCSAHPLVLEAALRHAHERDERVLIEATCNQVNQEGGYTGMTPAMFRDHVHALAGRIGLPREKIILGGDHLGPNPWRHLPPDEALRRAEAMVAAYAGAGFEKLHLDTSMGCAGEPAALPDAATAERAGRLARVAEAVAARAGFTPCYVIGTEVPVPGGAHEAIGHLEVTAPDAALSTWAVHRRAFEAAGVPAALDRVIAMVVQPGVEFGNVDVVRYQPDRAAALSAALDDLPGLVFEAHSTDYQPPECLGALVADGFAILKVGPALTFALREVLYGLDQIAGFLDPGWRACSLIATMERIMLADPVHWRSHYVGTDDEARVQRHFSYSDRIRYYWPHPEAKAAVAALLGRLAPVTIPATLASQFIPRLYPLVAEGTLKPVAEAFLLAGVRDVLQIYDGACAIEYRRLD